VTTLHDAWRYTVDVFARTPGQKTTWQNSSRAEAMDSYPYPLARIGIIGGSSLAA
jgi:hypothetical protein